jgi:hypothetical protein
VEPYTTTKEDHMARKQFYEVVIAADIPSYKRVRVKATSRRNAEGQVEQSMEEFADDETNGKWEDQRDLTSNLRVVWGATTLPRD